MKNYKRQMTNNTQHITNDTQNTSHNTQRMTNDKCQMANDTQHTTHEEKEAGKSWKAIWRDMTAPLLLLIFVLLMLLGLYFPPKIGILYQAVLLIIVVLMRAALKGLEDGVKERKGEDIKKSSW